MNVDLVQVIAPVFGASLTALLGFWLQQGSARRRIRREIKEALEIAELLDKREQVSPGLEQNLADLFVRYLPPPDVRLKRLNRRYVYPAWFVTSLGIGAFTAWINVELDLSIWVVVGIFVALVLVVGVGTALIGLRMEEAAQEAPWIDPVPIDFAKPTTQGPAET